MAPDTRVTVDMPDGQQLVWEAGPGTGQHVLIGVQLANGTVETVQRATSRGRAALVAAFLLGITEDGDARLLYEELVRHELSLSLGRLLAELERKEPRDPSAG